MELSSRFGPGGIGGLDVLSEDGGVVFCGGIEAPGGRLWAETNPEGGATFLFSLPDARNTIR